MALLQPRLIQSARPARLPCRLAACPGPARPDDSSMACALLPGRRLPVLFRRRQFYERARQPIALPTHRADRPASEFLEWHLDTIFKAS
jgi:hypothetical protein